MTAYATVQQFDVHGIRPEALPEGISETDKQSAILAASLKADSYLGSAFHLPLASWGEDLTQAVCAMAAYELVAGLLIFQPDPAKNEVLTQRRDAAIAWLKDIAAGRAKPTNVVDTAPAASTVSRVFSRPLRGW